MQAQQLLLLLYKQQITFASNQKRKTSPIMIQMRLMEDREHALCLMLRIYLRKLRENRIDLIIILVDIPNGCYI